MTGYKAVMTSQSYRQQKHVDTVSEGYKAARMAGSFLAKKSQPLTERWGQALTTYCDYFIRY